MSGVNERLIECRDMMLGFFKDINSVEALDMIIDIYGEIRYSEMDKKIAREKFLRVLNNLKESDSLYNLLDKNDRDILDLFLEDILRIKFDGSVYYIDNEYLNKLTLDELYHVLLETKYIKEKEIMNKKQLSI